MTPVVTKKLKIVSSEFAFLASGITPIFRHDFTAEWLSHKEKKQQLYIDANSKKRRCSSVCKLNFKETVACHWYTSAGAQQDQPNETSAQSDNCFIAMAH